jgi:prophage regulatory protein
MIINLVRRVEAQKPFAISKSAFYDKIKQGLIPPQISIGSRAVAWPEHEIQEVIKALVAGKSNNEIKIIVANLVAQRGEFV